MKFSDGEWLMQPGLTAFHPAEAREFRTADGRLTVYAPTRPIVHRGDTLGGPLLTIELDAPLKDVVRVKISHFSGGLDNRPRIPLQAQEPFVPEIAVGEGEAQLTSGSLSVRVKNSPWELSFVGSGKLLTRSAWRGIGYVQSAEGPSYVFERLLLGVGENVYGLGERFTAFVKNGQIVENENKDGGTGSNQAYKAVPFYLTNRGYGVLVNETGPVSFEIASERTARMQFSLPGESLEYFLIYGPSPKEILRKLTQLTGRPALPPSWTFGLWLTTSFTTSYDEKTCTHFLDEMKRRDLPLHVFHFDCFWMKEFEWCNFEWDAKVFPDPVSMLRRYHERGLKVCVWINPYIAQRSRLFEEGVKGGYFIRKTDGSVWQTDLWQPGMAVVDFTNPAARLWYTGYLEKLLDMGVDCFKTDFGERIPSEGVTYFDGSEPSGMHNLYSVLYNQAVFELLERKRGRGEAALFARSTYASGQRFPIHWGGDCWSTFESMAESLRGGLSLGLCGFGFWSHDIGGFEGQGPAAVYKRWVAFGLLSSHSRLHGSTSYRVPWNYDEEACDVVRFFTKLKCRLMPYLYAKAVEAHREGIPMLRAMMLEYPNDPATENLDRQYMLGDSLLVAPVFTEDGSVDFYLPQGKWTHLLSGKTLEGGRWHREQCGYLELPLYVKPGSLIAFGASEERPDYAFEKGVTFRLYSLEEGQKAEATVNTTGGTRELTATVIRKGGILSIGVQRSSSWAPWSILLVGLHPAGAPNGAKARNVPEGTLLEAEHGSNEILVRL